MIWNAEISPPSSFTAEIATSICAPYGMIPWKIQEKVSRSDAAFLGVIQYSCAISFAIGFAMTIATVLFAVAISIVPTSSPIPSWPPLFPRKIL